MSRRRVPRIGSLFSGIGGLELGAERAGLGAVAWQVEIDPHCRRVLSRHWPEAQRLKDVREVNHRAVSPVDVLVGGFPCQDISNNGERSGLDGEESGLWRQQHRIIGDLRPRIAIVENVSALLVRGMGEVLGDLAASGYDATWDCVPAVALGSPQQRDRLFIVAWRSWEPVVFASDLPICECCDEEPFCERHQMHYADCDCVGPTQDGWNVREEAWGLVANAAGLGMEGRRPARVEEPSLPGGEVLSGRGRSGGGTADGQADDRVVRAADGVSAGLERAWREGIERARAKAAGKWPAPRGKRQRPGEPPRLQDVKPAGWREQIEALGNAVVPAVGEAVGHVARYVMDNFTVDPAELREDEP